MHIIMTIIALLIVLGIVVLIHELGHFWAARWAGVRVDAFSIGFGPAIVLVFHWVAMFQFMAKKICLTVKNIKNYQKQKKLVIIFLSRHGSNLLLSPRVCL